MRRSRVAERPQSKVQADLAQFMQVNRDFISNQSEVTNSYAALLREGVKAKDLSVLMTTALHIQAAEGGTLADAVTKVQQAEVGRNRSLTTAVGLTLQAIKPSDTLAEKQKKIAANLEAVAKAYGHVKLTPLQVASDHLSTTWELLAEKRGPALVGAETAIVNYTNDSLIPSMEHTASVMDDTGSALDRLVQNPSWEQFYNVLFNPNARVLPGSLPQGGMPADPNSPSIYAQQHKGQPGYSTAAHKRGAHAGRNQEDQGGDTPA
jgi:hypothetical protein